VSLAKKTSDNSVTLAAHPWYYCVDDGGEIVTDVWVPWKGW
jgi:hypothetical protein